MVLQKIAADRAHELALQATPAARQLVAQIAADPSAPLCAAVVGPGGTGKSAVLDAVAAAYGCAGVEVTRVDGRRAQLPPIAANAAVLVAGAQQLSPAILDELRALVDSDEPRLVIAYRPWPRSRSLSELAASVTRRRAPVVVGHLPRSAVASRIAARLGAKPPDDLVDVVHEQSGGLPKLVDLITQALVDSGRFDPCHPERFKRPDRITVSPGLAERLRPQVDALEPAVHGLLEAMAVGASLEGATLSAVLDTDEADLVDIVEAGLATGLLTDDGQLIPLIKSLVLRLMPILRTRSMQQRLAGIQLDRGGSVLSAGRQLLGTGASGTRVAAVLEAAADEALTQSSTLAAELFAGAVEAGADRRALAARRAHAVALSGDLDQALRLTDEILCDPDAPGRERAISVASAALAHRGLLANSADMARSLPVAGARGPALAVPALVGTGALEDAQAVLDAVTSGRNSRASTIFAEAEVLMAKGMLATLGSSPTAALSQLGRAAVLLEPVGDVTLLPDTPAALTAVVALHCGELAIADAALRRAVDVKLGGRPAQMRHLLLHGWVLMARGKLAAAHRALDQSARAAQHLEPRDELFAAALAVGLARREDDMAALASAWTRARIALVRHPIDLYTLRPLGELAVAATTLGEREWVTPHVKEAECLLDELGNPVLWAASLHWDEMHAAIVAGQPAEAQRHADALEAATASSYAAVLSVAARSWLRILAGEVDPDDVHAAAVRLGSVGLSWEGARLAAQAAARATDRRSMATLLATARSLHASAPGTLDAPSLDEDTTADGTGAGHSPARTAPAAMSLRVSAPTASGAPGARPTTPAAQERSILSDREIEVGQLILSGLTYKQIGERLFISAKTVEHHVARMRQRLGVESRNELFARLRSLIDGAVHSGT